MTDRDKDDLREAFVDQNSERFEDVLQSIAVADFYRRMRFARHLFPSETGSDHARKSWGDIFESFEEMYAGPDTD